jgi:putative ABC transport system permease protein
MNVFTLTLAYLRNQPVTTFLTLLLLSLGVGTIVVLLLFQAQLEDRLTRDLRGIDLVVGAKGSPLQLILSAVYHVDVPTGNITLDQAREVVDNPMVAAAIPLALGDSVAGFRIVGSTHAYPEHYGATLAEGRLWEDGHHGEHHGGEHEGGLEAVLGAQVAARTGWRVGDGFIGVHGVGGGGAAHADHPYTVVGILQPTGTVIDRLVLTSVESVWEVHDHAAGAGAVFGVSMPDPDEQITALLVTYRTPLAAVTLPRLINMQTPMQAASPALEVARLFQLLGVGVTAFRAFALLLIATAAVSVFASLYNALKERQYDLAIMRTVGATRRVVFLQLLLEGLLLSVGGTLLGLALGQLAAEALGVWLRAEHQIPFTGAVFVVEELWLLALSVAVGVLAAAIPAVRAYRLDIAAVLARG